MAHILACEEQTWYSKSEHNSDLSNSRTLGLSESILHRQLKAVSIICIKSKKGVSRGPAASVLGFCLYAEKKNYISDSDKNQYQYNTSHVSCHIDTIPSFTVMPH